MKGCEPIMEKYYFGYYSPDDNEDTLLCISQSKRLVKDYLENIRRLNKSNYTIESEYQSDESIIYQYDEFVLYEFNAFYIPLRDICIIEESTECDEGLLRDTIHGLKEITKTLMATPKKYKSEISQFLKTIQLLINLNTSKKYPKLTSRCHSILYCDMHEYTHWVIQYNYSRDMKERFRNGADLLPFN